MGIPDDREWSSEDPKEPGFYTTKDCDYLEAESYWSGEKWYVEADRINWHYPVKYLIKDKTQEEKK